MIDICTIQPNKISANTKSKFFFFHGEPGTWKTTVASQFPKSLLLGFEIGYQFIDIPIIKMRANVGPVFYFAVGKAEYAMNGEDLPISTEGVTENMTMGAALNLGVDIWKLTLDINYSLGLTDVFDDEIEFAGHEIDLGDDTKQNIFTVTLGFKIL